jgi:hypothetical protein
MTMAPPRPAVVPAPASRPAPPPTKTVPFDHSFQFSLNGEPGRTHRGAVTVSVEASFTALSIGYGVVPEITPIVFGADLPPPGQPPPGANLRQALSLRNIRFNEVLSALERTLSNAPDLGGDTTPLEAALRNGIRLNPQFVALALQGNGNGDIDPASFARLFEVASAPPEDAPFLYSLFDEGSGREFQSGPILSIAGLGSSDGKRPFRYFATPITFRPLSTIRMEITELGRVRGELHVALHGYKMLGGAAVETPGRERRRRR